MLSHAMCWAFRPDNSGPPSSVSEVVAYFNVARAAFPGAAVHASTHDRFVRARFPNANPEHACWGYSCPEKDTYAYTQAIRRCDASSSSLALYR